MAEILRLVTAAAAAGFLLAIAACGGSSTSSSSSSSGGGSSGQNGSGGSGSKDARTLLTQSIAAQISGDPNVAQLSQACSPNVCIYVDTTSPGGGGASIFVETLPSGVSQTLVQQAIQHAGGSGANVQQISGVGDAAYKDVESNNVTIAFVKGNTLVALGASSRAGSGASLESGVESAAQQMANSL